MHVVHIGNVNKYQGKPFRKIDLVEHMPSVKCWMPTHRNRKRSLNRLRGSVQLVRTFELMI